MFESERAQVKTLKDQAAYYQEIGFMVHCEQYNNAANTIESLINILEGYLAKSDESLASESSEEEAPSGDEPAQ